MKPGRIAVLVFLLFGIAEVMGQPSLQTKVASQYAYFNNLYGLDHLLINGVWYMPEVQRAEGHPFLDDAPFIQGEIRIRYQTYADVLLAYDVYTRKVILKYLNPTGTYEMIMLPNHMIQEFRLGDRTFVKLDHPEIGETHFQVVRGGDLSCYYRWSKTVSRKTGPVETFTYYSDLKRKLWLQRGEGFYSFKTKSGFIKIFDKSYQKKIKGYLKIHRLEFKTISDQQMADLLSFCNEFI